MREKQGGQGETGKKFRPRGALNGAYVEEYILCKGVSGTPIQGGSW